MGWSPDEFTAAGASMAERGARAEEYLTVLNRLFGPDPVEHEGRFYQVPRGSFGPKPLQRSMPLPLGGGARAIQFLSVSRAI